MRFARLLAALPALLLAAIASAQTAVAPLDTTRQLLDWLGVDEIVAQTPQIAAQALQSEAKFRNADAAQVARWRQALNPKLNPTALHERIARAVAAQADAGSIQQAFVQLQTPLPKRARYFELAMAQPGAGLGFQAYRVEIQTAPPAPARRQLVHGVTDAAGTDRLLAQWQTTIAAEVWRAAEGQPMTVKLQDDMTKERQRHLAPLDEVYALYAYRYLTDAELGTYRDILGDKSVQSVIEVCRRNLAQALTE